MRNNSSTRIERARVCSWKTRDVEKTLFVYLDNVLKCSSFLSDVSPPFCALTTVSVCFDKISQSQNGRFSTLKKKKSHPSRLKKKKL